MFDGHFRCTYTKLLAPSGDQYDTIIASDGPEYMLDFVKMYLLVFHYNNETRLH